MRKFSQNLALILQTSEANFSVQIDGERLNLILNLTYSSWAECVLNVIYVAQRLGRSWVITDDVSTNLSLFSSQISLTGVSAVSIDIANYADEPLNLS